MSNPIDFIDQMNQTIYGDDWTMEKAQKLLQEMSGVPNIMLGNPRSKLKSDALCRTTPWARFINPTSTRTD